MAFNLVEVTMYVAALGVIVSLFPAVIAYYTQIYRPKKREEEEETQRTIKKEKDFIDAFIQFLNNVKLETQKNNLQNPQNKNNFNYYLYQVEDKLDEYNPDLKVIDNIYEELKYLTIASKYILQNEINNTFKKYAKTLCHDSPNTIQKFITHTLIPYLESIKITEQYLKENHLDLYVNFMSEINLPDLNRIFNRNNNFSENDQIINRYREKKKELINHCDKLILKI